MMKRAAIQAIEYYLPERVLRNQDLTDQFPEWSVDKIAAKTGIHIRHIAGKDEYASDLAVKAAEKLFERSNCTPSDIDFILFCTQSPDYALPSTACLIQQRLGCRRDIGALDFNLGCSGYIYGVSLAKALIETNQASNVLLLTADTYTKYIAEADKDVRTIFGDGAAATWITAKESDIEHISVPSFGTDGSGEKNLVVPGSGARHLSVDEANKLYMNGPEIFRFTLQVVPEIIQRQLDQQNLALEDVDLFVFHQANQYMLEHLRKKLDIPTEKFVISLADSGNTVSATIPIAIKNVSQSMSFSKMKKVMLVGFGVGYSWGSLMVDLSGFEK